MKQTIFTIAMIVAVLSFPMDTSAKDPKSSKGNSFGKAVLLKDANGMTVARVIGMETIGWPYVLTREGYRTFFRLGNGKVSVTPDDGVFYNSIDCTGVAYVNPGYFLGTVFSPTPQFGAVYAAGAVLYTPHDAPRVTVDSNSMLKDSNTGCVPFVEKDAQGYPAYPNDPNITGIENTAYPTRMLIE